MRLSEIREVNKTITEIDIKQIEEMISSIIMAGIIAHKEGLLGLQEFADKAENSFLKNGCNLVIDGTEPELVKELLENKYYANGRSSAAALCDLLAIEGVLGIQSGNNPVVLEKKLRSMVCDRVESKFEKSLYQIEKEKYRVGK